MTDKELADQVEAGKRLEANGYRRHQCEACKGTGHLHVAGGHPLAPCLRCEGKGYHWEAPIV